MKDPRSMSASEINAALDLIDRASNKLNDAFIARGRGHERYSETLAKSPTSDPLTARFHQLHDERHSLRHEVARRAGPGTRRLPRGFGPLKSGAYLPQASDYETYNVLVPNAAYTGWRHHSSVVLHRAGGTRADLAAKLSAVGVHAPKGQDVVSTSRGRIEVREWTRDGWQPIVRLVPVRRR